tara:strand:- start:45561 stop:45962 length:402 start_codon:yes stop_codon:yes gene_type:complete
MACRCCGEAIEAIAKKCRFCDFILDEGWGKIRIPDNETSTADKMLMSVGRPVSAIIAGYCGLFSIIPVFGLPFQIAAIACGIKALKTLKRTPELSSAVRAWFGIIFGLIGLLSSIVGVLSLLRQMLPNVMIEN